MEEGGGLLIYSAAVPEENEERTRARELGVQEFSYFEALGKVAEGKKIIAVSGTHGKTTTTAMIAKILRDARLSPYAIVGGIVTDFGSNFLPGASDILVVEACEYKRHFLNLSADVLVITNIELDHTDYYKDLDDLISGFHSMAKNVKEGGAIIANTSLNPVEKAVEGLTAGLIDYTEEHSPELQLIGTFNQENAKAAKAAARAFHPKIEEGGMDDSLRSFRGTWRRFEYKGKTATGASVYDDYAHHPTAIEKTLTGVRGKFPGKAIVVAFHPHLYSRTKSLLSEFARALAKADEVVLAPIYAAREENDPAISSDILAGHIVKEGGRAESLSTFELIEKRLSGYAEGTILITMGAGDIYKVAEKLAKS